MSVKIDRRGMDQLMKNAEQMNGTHQVELNELMSPAFISAHSKFPDLASLFEASGYKFETKEDFSAIPDDEWDRFIAENTDFGNWLEMQHAAGANYIRAGLNKGL